MRWPYGTLSRVPAVGALQLLGTMMDRRDLLIRSAAGLGALSGATAAFPSRAARAASHEPFPRVRPEEVGLSSAGLDRIPEQMREFVRQNKIAGAVTLVARHGKLAHFVAVGDADIEMRKKMRTDSIFWLASQAKPTTATAIMVLVDQGKVRLDEPVATYLPAFKNIKLKSGSAPQKPPTVRHVMSHTAGLAQPFRDPNDGAYTLAQYANRLASRPLEFEPGSAYEYGYGLTVCGGIVEAVSGKLFEDFLEANVFGPAGMKDTTFNPTREQWPRLTKTYKPGPNGAIVPAYNPFITQDWTVKRFPEPSGGLLSTTGDMARFYQMYLNGGEIDGRRILSREAVQTVTTPQMAGGKPITYALGWQTVPPPATGGARVLSGYGHGGAFATDGFIDPSRGLVTVLMIQRTQFPNGGEIGAAFRKLVAEALG